MAELGHKYVEQTTLQQDNPTVWTTVLTLSNTDLTAGRKYLLWAIAVNGTASGTRQASMRLAHGSGPTSFAETEQTAEGINGPLGIYNMFVEWTAVSGEDVVVQHKTSASVSNVKSDQITLVAIDLDGLAAGDYYYDDYTTDTDLTTTPADGAEIIFTPGNSNDDWLVVSTAVFVPDDSLTIENGTRIEHGADVQPRAEREGEDITDRVAQTLVRPYTLPSTSQTFTEQSYTIGGAGNSRVYSAIFALRLNAFADHIILWNAGALTIAHYNGGNFPTEVNSTLITPGQAGEVFVLGGFVYDPDSTWEMTGRMQVYENGQAEVDQPPTQTADAYEIYRPYDSTDALPWYIMTVENLSGSTQYDIDIDAGTDEDTDAHAEERSVVAFTFELAAAAASSFLPPPRSQRNTLLRM